MPGAWMVSSNATEETIHFYLSQLNTLNPAIHPEWFMGDMDKAQENAILRMYPETKFRWCWWHVLHAWQQHFSVTAYPIFWELLKKWIRVSDEPEFQEILVY